MEIALRPILKEEVLEKWDEIAGWVASSLGIDKSYSVNDVKLACESGAIALWIIYKDLKPTGFLTTTFNQNPRGITAYAPWLGGENLADWVAEGFEQLKKYLKEQNCLSFSWMGRDAWEKLVNVDSKQRFYSINL